MLSVEFTCGPNSRFVSNTFCWLLQCILDRCNGFLPSCLHWHVPGCWPCGTGLAYSAPVAASPGACVFSLVWRFSVMWLKSESLG